MAPRPLPQPNNTGKLVVGLVVVGAVAGILFYAWPASASSTDPGIKDLPKPPPPDPKPDDVPVVDFEKENTFCKFATEDPPKSYGTRVRGVNQPLEEWLAFCAYWETYPDAPTNPQGHAHWEDAYGRILSCVRQRLKQVKPDPPKPDPKPEPDPEPEPEKPKWPEGLPAEPKDAPTPDATYQIRPGPLNNLYAVISAAYGTQKGTPANHKAAARVNNHPYNKRFRVIVENEKNLFPDGRISFTAIFGTVEQQVADADKGGRGLGSNFAMMYLPPAKDVLV